MSRRKKEAIEPGITADLTIYLNIVQTTDNNEFDGLLSVNAGAK